MDLSGILSGGPVAFRLLLLLLLQDLAIGIQNLQVIQSPDSVSVAAGETLTLNCILEGINYLGGIRWYKGKDGDKKLIYAGNTESFSRAERVFPRSTEDFSIRIWDIQPEDAGVYYCTNYFVFRPMGASQGNGTKVSVLARPSQPVLHDPAQRMRVGSVAVFSCTAEGFSPQEIEVIWSKDGRRIQEAQTKVLPEGQQGTSFRVESTVELLLTRDDMRSWITCEIQHSTLARPLKEEYPLSDILRVPPKVRLDTSPPSPVLLNTTVTVTCHVEEFYPEDAKAELFMNSLQSIKGMVDFRTQNSDGTFSLKSILEVTATKDRNLSHFTCFVKHNVKPHFTREMTLFIRTQEESPPQYTLLGLGIGLFLNKLGTLLLLLFMVWKKEH